MVGEGLLSSVSVEISGTISPKLKLFPVFEERSGTVSLIETVRFSDYTTAGKLSTAGDPNAGILCVALLRGPKFCIHINGIH